MSPSEACMNAKKALPVKDGELRIKDVQGMTVLIVDDQAESVQPLKRILQDQGCTVYFLNDAREAGDVLTNYEEIELVFLDWNMPKIEGGEALEKAEKKIASSDELTEAWSHRSIPVVTYSAAKRESIHIPRTSHFAFIDFWPKTMRLSELQLQVQSLMDYVQNRSH